VCVGKRETNETRGGRGNDPRGNFRDAGEKMLLGKKVRWSTGETLGQGFKKRREARERDQQKKEIIRSKDRSQKKEGAYSREQRGEKKEHFSAEQKRSTAEKKKKTPALDVQRGKEGGGTTHVSSARDDHMGVPLRKQNHEKGHGKTGRTTPPDGGNGEVAAAPPHPQEKGKRGSRLGRRKEVPDGVGGGAIRAGPGENLTRGASNSRKKKSWRYGVAMQALWPQRRNPTRDLLDPTLSCN